MNTPFWPLLALLADGQAHNVRTLANTLNKKIPQLNAAWQEMPVHIQNLLRQHNDVWQLTKTLALIPEHIFNDCARQHGFNPRLLVQTTSTNTILLEQLRHAPTDTLPQICLAYEQTAGRGRQGKSWQNRIGECLMFSLSWSFLRPQAQLGGLALVVALAVAQTLRELGITAQIKWPNDLMLDNSKLGGILIETIPQQKQTTAIIGIGLNFSIPDQIGTATAIQSLQPQAQVTQIFQGILARLVQYLPHFNQHGLSPFLNDYNLLHRDQGQLVHLLVDGCNLAEGTVSGIAASGALLLQTASGERSFVTGEISLRPGAAQCPKTQSSKKRYLLLDAGNSKLKWAWVENGCILSYGKAAYYNLQPLIQDWAQHGASVQRIIGCAVCSKVRQQQIASILPCSVTWLSSMPEALGIYNHYRNPAEHGADRWFNVIGCRRYSQQACVVISCGTAVTIDALTDNNHYLGGSILPGFHLMKEALSKRTANLNRPLGKPYAFATTTPNAMASGIMDAVCGAIVLMHTRLQQKIGAGKPVDIIITGGGANKVAQALPNTFVLDNRIEIVDNLVIYGLLNWVEYA
ncbi:MAG: biotin--[acetyl-CoA-carboxylase] ligase [Snodgrassella sp.]|uniref:biotin--[acetyl-CoA-carboxylase] ligase n=1 Tax=Snodgrassella sp. TaxID=2815304 RepID=UPI00258DB1E5|nr:biotin--[acetyl-CoA-carboxylase] ligase [Snodgrassella sp.]MCO6513092.1 biotin--[acetyl-CoA-carboxylase] ligase [Snodgrassella sp.]